MRRTLQALIYWNSALKEHMSWSAVNPQAPPADLYMYQDEDALTRPEMRPALGKPRKTLVEKIARSGDPGPTQPGDLPEWVQDEAYPACPQWKETIRFSAQLKPVDLVWAEGIISAFACFACGISTTGYQQT
jgi:hypothetical protein